MSYPEQLEKLIRRKVVNAGVAGEGSAEGARRLPGVLAEHEPDLVILGHGGNGLRPKPDRQQLQTDLRRMFEAANQRGIPVVMIAVPHPGVAGDDVDLYEELAKELKIPLVHATLGDLLTDRQNKNDPIDRNANDYRKLAEAVADKLDELNAI